MSAPLIAVVLVMILLIGFVLIIIHSLASAAGFRIRTDMVKLLGSYDNMIAVKSKEVSSLQKEIKELQKHKEEMASANIVMTDKKSVAPQGTASIAGSASYRSSKFLGGYDTVRKHFHLSRKERENLVEIVSQFQDEKSIERGKEAKKLRETFSFDTIFALSQLGADEQLRIVDESLSDEDWRYLHEFHKNGGDFSITNFCDWLEDISKLDGGEISVRCGDLQKSEESDMAYQRQICEGIQIVAGNRIYDYSIKESEIG